MTPPFIGNSPSILGIKEIINQLAHSHMNVLITGETGVGKEVVAQHLFSNSSGLPGNFVKLNCAALPETLFEAELFGFERGSFTDAHTKHNGKLLKATKGVLFLDEIGDMPLRMQSKLLHVLQDGKFSPIGSSKEIKTNAWIIAATNQDLQNSMAKKQFREDLFYRLNIINIHIPPLRERKEDIPTLINYYHNLYEGEYSHDLQGKPNKETIAKLTDYPWPGNVRQLQNFLKNQMVFNSWDLVIKDLLGNPSNVSLLNTLQNETKNQFQQEHSKQENLVPNFLSEYENLNRWSDSDVKNISLKEIKKKVSGNIEKEVILYILEKSDWNRSIASKILKVNYKTLLNKITKLEINPPPSGLPS